MPRASDQLLGALLKDVSRSFYLTLRILPSQIRSPIGLAYLLARTTDTIADTDLVPLDSRLLALDQLCGRILGTKDCAIDFGELSQKQGIPAERVLLQRSEESLSLLHSMPTTDQKLIQEVLSTITGGQELDLRRFRDASVSKIIALQTGEELDDYTFRVAGCVGEFWTKMCRARLYPQAKLDDKYFLENGVRFGKGLQLVNILRDLAGDLRKGRCYLPANELAEQDLAPQELLDASKEPRLRMIYDRWLERAEAHLRAGWGYTNALPRRQVRVRLACAWPVLLGLETIKLLRNRNVLDPQQRAKVPRQHVRRVIRRSLLLYPWSKAWRGLAS